MDDWTFLKRLLMPAGLLAVLLIAASAATAAERTLPGHVPADVTTALPTKHLDAPYMRLAIALPPSNPADLARFLRNIYTPYNHCFHHYLTAKEFTTRFGPSESDYQAVERYAESNGLSVVDTLPTRMVLDVAGPVASVEKAFHINELVYMRLDGTTFYAPDKDPSVPDSLPAITAITGLDDANPPRPAGENGSGPDGGYTGSDLRTAYNIPPGLTGAGQTIGVLEQGGYPASDVAEYESYYGINVPVQAVLLDGVSGVDPTQGEAALDIEDIVGLDPGLSALLVYCGGSALDIYSRAASDDIVSVFSISLCYSPGYAYEQAENTIFQQMAAEGISVFAASGDWDAWGTGGAANLDDPEDQPFLTCVGGTTLVTVGPGGPWDSEVAWDWGNGVSSGGGYNTDWPIPWYQVGTPNLASTQYRNGPDVAADADPDTGGYSTYFEGEWGVLGGTSGAAPFWAALTGLLNQQRAMNGLGPAGFLNPLLYPIGNGPNYDSDFHDIISGSNVTYTAGPGYDNVTGWGSPIADNLINDLAVDNTASTGNQVNLGPVANVYGLYTDGTSYSTGGIGGGWAYSAEQVGPVVNWNGTNFNMGPPNVPDVVTSTTVPLPPGQYQSLLMVGGADFGNQAAQTFTVTYSDNSTQTYTQSLSDWAINNNNAGESLVSTMGYRNYGDGSEQAITIYIYGYSFALNSGKSVTSITLPENADVFALGMSLTGGSMPGTPVGLTANAGSGQVTLVWGAGSGATSYSVYQGSTSGGEGATPIASGLTSTTYTNTGLTNGYTYFYTVSAANAAGTSTQSNEASSTPTAVTIPSAPSNLSAAGGASQVSLSWTPSTGATSYNIYRGTASGSEDNSPLATQTGGPDYTDTAAVNGTTYYYFVSAVNAAGQSPVSNEASATPNPLPLPGAPGGLTATSGNCQVTLSWTASNAAASYDVFQSTVSGGEGATPAVTNVIAATDTITGLTDGVTYYFTAAAVNSTGTSAQSKQVSATPSAPQGSTHVLWSKTDGTLSLWNYTPETGAYTQNTYGPYPDWSAKAIADGPDGLTRMLWVSTSGAASIWTITDATGAFAQHIVGPFPDWAATGLSVSPDDTTHILWVSTAGAASVWNYETATGAFTQSSFGPYADWTPDSIADGPDGDTRLLWTSTGGAASVWSVDAITGQFTQSTFGPYNGWTATAVSVNAANINHMLWTSNGGAASLWNVDTDDGSFSQNTFGPYPGWTASSIADGPDGNLQVIWDDGGAASFWDLDNSTGAFTQNSYGPFAAWTASAVTAYP
ncbi:MAG: protease pro-enzyme activation domain-containing protein [Capsulimonadaceae bacterium]